MGVATSLLLIGCEKARLDEEVKRLCGKDGGVKVYETVSLPSGRFDRFGNVAIPRKEKARDEDEFFYEHEIQYLKKGNPEMWRSHNRVIRRKDGKLLGESIAYTRRGGDMPGPWHESSLTCPDLKTLSALEQSIFVKQ